MKRKIFIILPIVIVIIGIIGFKLSQNDDNTEIEAKVKKGKFEVTVVSTGELQAEKSQKILGPSLDQIGIWKMKILNIVPEGTLVDSGEFVASIDQTEILTKLKDIEDQIQNAESQFTKVQLDTSLELRNTRDNLINLKYSMEEYQLTLDQSKYEPPATIRQATINLEKAKRDYKQAQENYFLKVEQNKAKMQEVSINLQKQKREKQNILNEIDKFTVTAPMSGMVIYVKDWGGNKRKANSEFNSWDPVVATLPDLTTMISKTYINEIDISKIKVGSKVIIGVDAFPGKKYSGTVTEVSNIGESLQSSNAKVFEVLIRVNGSDSILRPAMTTSNSIITNVYDNEIFVPLESIHSNDSMTFVYKKSGSSIEKQIIETGESNENEIIVKKGVTENDVVLLTIPENAEELKYSGLEIYKELKKKEEELRIKKEKEIKELTEKQKFNNPPDDSNISAGRKPPRPNDGKKFERKMNRMNFKRRS